MRARRDLPGASSTPLASLTSARNERSSYPAAPLASRRSSIGPCSPVMSHPQMSHESTEVLSL